MDLAFIDILERIDSQLLLWINSMHSPGADVFMKTVTNKWLWIPISIVVAFFVMRKGGTRRGLLFLLCAGLAIAISDQVCASLLRPAIERMRPSNPLNPLSQFVHVVDEYRGGRFGFPSCHASTTFSVAVMLSLYFRNRIVTAALFAWVALLCYSRMYLGVHYPGDILAGAVVGCLAAAISYLLYKKLITLRPIRIHLPHISFRTN